MSHRGSTAMNSRLRMCYFTNVYPAPSHTTMRREINALECLGVTVTRAAARPFVGPLAEFADEAEATRTVYTAASLMKALVCLARVAVSRPKRLAHAVFDAFAIGSTSQRGIWKYLMYVGEAAVLLKSARGCDHIHANFGNATAIAVMSRVLGGPPISLRIHGPEEFDSFTSAEWNWKLTHAAFVAPISDYGSRKIRDATHPRHHAKIGTLRCGIDSDAIGITSMPPASALHLVCVARLEARKGHEVLLKALTSLQETVCRSR